MSAEEEKPGSSPGTLRAGSAGSSRHSSNASSRPKPRQPRWALGILNDRETDEVPGSILLLSDVSDRNAPLGMQYAPRRSSASSLPPPFPPRAVGDDSHPPDGSADETKKASDGKTILEPQPDESQNDPLNWSALRRDAALLSLGLYCMVGGGMTPILAAGFTNVADTYNVTVPQVALTTGLYMMGLGIGSVIASPTAIAFGKRPVYLFTACCFILSSVWCAKSPSYSSLVVARIFQGLVVSPVECLPSATIAEIFFLHERAYRLGVYTLLLLGGKNLVPLVSAAIIQSMGWRWVFWIVAIVVGFCLVLLFLFVPETFWERTPRPHHKPTLHHGHRPRLNRFHSKSSQRGHPQNTVSEKDGHAAEDITPMEPKEEAPDAQPRRQKSKRARFAQDEQEKQEAEQDEQRHQPRSPTTDPDRATTQTNDIEDPQRLPNQPYTAFYRSRPPKSFLATLRPLNGRLTHDSWYRVALRPFILLAYPAILWSTAVYALSVGWLIVLSESVAAIYRSPHSYHFSALSTGLIYISPFVGGILGTAVAGKASDFIVKRMARRNGGVYEPEFRLVMAAPVALATTAGLMGFGWSAEERDAWIVPTVFFGIVSFGCSLGSTTAITFAVDSYRLYAGEALVTLNFCKNILHGLVFSLFINRWLEGQGSRTVFLALGGIQLGVLVWSVPMYIFGKRCRMWTVRRGFMERF